MLRFKQIIFLLILVPMIVYAGTTGKIAGQVLDSETGDPLPGVNVFLEGTILGAATDIDGFYYIINIPPGQYTVKLSFVGYVEYTVTNVDVAIDLTTKIDVALRSEILSTESVVVTAVRPVIQKDVAATQKIVTSADIQALPVTTLTEALGLQAGITAGLGIRGSAANEALFVVDGISMRDGRTNNPITEIPLSALQELSVQSGGFGAEYSNLRSGVINVVSRDGDKDKYSGVLTFRYKPAQQKHFGGSPFDQNSFYNRPYLDPAVAWTGTNNGVWDEYTRRQYPGFDGWNAIAEQTLQNDNPADDLTPEAAQRIFMWEHRKQGDIKDPDYNIDGGFGGPMPFISKSLGDLRFFFSYKQEVQKYLMALTTDDIRNETFMLKLTSDLSPTMKLSFLGLQTTTNGTSSSRSGFSGIFSSSWGIANAVERIGFTAPWRIYTSIYFSQAETKTLSLAATFKHVLNPSTFYEARVTRLGKKYTTGPVPDRNRDKVFELFPGYFADEAPIGYERDAVFSVEGRLGMGGAVSVGRDTTTLVTHSLEFDLTSQIDRHNQIKTGFKFYVDKLEMGFGMINYFLPEGNTWTRIDQSPIRLSMYVQDKIEYEGFIANAGVIMDLIDPNDKWYDVEPFDRNFYSADFSPELESLFKTQDQSAQITFSPRLAISHPITENSKLFFNYGHYRQFSTAERLYRMQRDIRDKLDFIGDPGLPMATTVSYELGYDQALFSEFLLRVSAYYKDIKDQERWVRYISADGKINYSKVTSNSYEDIRGFEIDLTKRLGRWVTGNLNYEYRVGTSGFFDRDQIYENPADQRNYDSRNPYQSRPRPQPRFKGTIDLHTPMDFGPQWLDQMWLADWHFNFIGRWTSGDWFTWNPQNIAGTQFNVQWNDFSNVDLRISKIFPFEYFDIKFIADVQNLLNHKVFSNASFFDSFDYDFYMKSLHLPENVTNTLNYGSIPGDDNPGDYRKAGVAYQPMEWIRDVTTVTTPSERAIYYEAISGKYMEYRDDAWRQVDQGRLDRINDDKAYIDMPNQDYFTFLNPRSIYLGIQLNFRF